MGKMSLCKSTFPNHPYVSLEPLDMRDFAVQDPQGFLSEYSDGVLLDEIQRAPDLFSYLQEVVDRGPTPGRFILTAHNTSDWRQLSRTNPLAPRSRTAPHTTANQARRC